ncbi:ribonuclease P [Salinigranum rubrum]|uniref:Ribonuclease P protein component 3 n=1 Tax=Salinigranum rubrum TaxID=755307 RepID=A0A2I8VHN2_9EURY|nr:RNase P subunit p30 family protein [Salinigranum rubrum]AUV81443.1 ribonuclease P [Salinigranum rubrum]
MYEAVYATPGGETTVARYAHAAARYGYDGVVVRATSAPDEGYREAYRRVRERFGTDVVDGVEVVADTPESAAGAVGSQRGSRTLLLVRGGTNRLNRFAVEQARVDVLTRPFDGNDGDGDVNHVLVKAARDNGVRIEFGLGPVLRLDGGRRVKALRKLRKLRELVEAYDAPYVVSATPRSHLQLRAPRELDALGEVLGFEAGAMKEGLREWGRLTERNRHRLSESFIAPGVERGRYEEDA